MKYLKIIISLLLVFTLGLLTYYLNNMYLFKNILVVVVIAVLVIFSLLLIFGLFKSKSKIIKLITVVLMLLIILINGVGSYYLAVTDSFFNKFDNKVVEYKHYYLFTLNDSGINSIKDLKDKNVGVTKDNEEYASKYIKVKCNIKVNDSITDLISGLYVEELDAVLVNDIEKFVWQEYDDDFFNKIKIFESFKEKKKEEDVIKPVEFDMEKPFIIYISGIDNNGTIDTIGRSDVNIVMTVNPKTRQVLLTSIPRDYYVQLHGTTGVRDKLTHSGIYGIDMSITTIEDLLNIDITHYAKVNFNTVTNLIDIVGGVDVHSDIAIKHCKVVPGTNHLNGKNALCFARERKSYSAGDRQRGVNQEIVIEALINKVSTSKDLLLRYNEVLNSLSNNLNTNISSDFIKQMVGFQIDQMPAWNIRFLNLDGYGASKVTYSGGNMVLYVMEPNYDTVNSATAAINDILNGKLFSEMNYNFTK